MAIPEIHHATTLDAVNIASQVVVAGSGPSFEDACEHELKGVPDRWHLYRAVSA